MKRTPGVLQIVIVLIAFASPAFAQGAQAPARDTAAVRRTGTSRIRGRVVAADTSAPVKRAVVRLTAPELAGEARSRMTDGDGRYEFRDLPAGSYTIYATKTGFLGGAMGGARPEDLPKTLKLGDAEAVTADDVTLMRGGAISGRVVDDLGEPVSTVQVSVMRSTSIGGVRRLITSGGATTDDLGSFRAFALPPGTYYVFARALLGTNSDTGDGVGFAPTYYPGTANLSEAQPVQLAAGQDLGGIDLMLTTVRVARVTGVALDSRGRPAANASVSADQVEPGLLMGGASAYARVQPDGVFTLNAVPPGDYVLQLRVSSAAAPGTATPSRTEYGRARIAVAGSDLSGLMIQASPGATVSGQVVFEAAAPPGKSAMTVTATPAPSYVSMSSPPMGPPAQVAADGTFALTGVFGERLFRVNGQPSGWVLKAVYAGGRDVTDTGINVEGREQITGVQIVLTDRLTHLTGSITDESGQPAENAYIVLLPEDPARLTPASRFVRSMTVRPGTPLKIDGLPSGDYLAVAFKSVANDFDPMDPESFEYARKAGVRFSLREAETRNLTLRLVATPTR